ncbi:MAG: glutamyl-tRNA reductase [Candidatus Omnitrophica bacterium]|nr:glutamyl-tRNA reductase [Candidatus Omnitrophota bacterium]
MHISSIGLNHKICPIAVRERLAFSKTAIQEALARMKQNIHASEWFLLSTCNRVEAYFISHGTGHVREEFEKFLSDFHNIEIKEFRNCLYQYEDEEAVRHLFKVICGLDSLVLGENEIHGQIKESFTWASEAGTLGPVLGRLFERAFQVSKKARTETKINEGAVSIPSVAVELAEKIFGRLHGEKVLVLGTGEMSELTLKHLVASGAGAILVANRTYEKAVTLAARFNAEAVHFDDWLTRLKSVDIVITSTAAPHAIVTHEDVVGVMRSRRQKPLFLIDIAVPRDVESEVAKIDDVYLYNIDDLRVVAESNLKERKKEIESCEHMILEKSEEFFKWLNGLESSEVINRFREYLDFCLEQELNGRFHALPEEERKQLADRLRGKIMHAPLEKLKEAAKNGGSHRYLEAIEALFDLERMKR